MPLEHAAPGTKGFEKNIREMVESGHPQKQAVAAAYEAARGDSGAPFATGPSPINQSAHPVDRVLAEAEKFYTRMDSVTRDCGRADAEFSKGDRVKNTRTGSKGRVVGPHPAGGYTIEDLVTGQKVLMPASALSKF